MKMELERKTPPPPPPLRIPHPVNFGLRYSVSRYFQLQRLTVFPLDVLFDLI